MDESNLARIPAEVRNDIFGLCLEQDEPLVIDQHSLPTLPAITATCKQIRDETKLRYYVGRTVIIQLPSPHDHKVDSLERALKDTIDNVSRWTALLLQLPRKLAPRFEVRISVEFRSQLTNKVKNELLRTHSVYLPKLANLLEQSNGQQPHFVYTIVTPATPWAPTWHKPSYEDWGFRYRAEGIVKVVARSRRDSFEEMMERLRIGLSA
ncbi:hypothetical protein LTR56_021680 [Elasticomyces elasticus]|nr:hypothetical protein LTR56_021680 [Elasticomyces elasticus]KAK3664837.1 hypothetical protein LTR22_004427 [Elasticomyces elasticus]KAK4928646.1 hypothetical protein LTR49_004769 [Elasticomyces elasticus]KAK5765216.1 hypothetical protein LTS12_004730 [Elasticomyces elasticus]